MPRLRHPCSRLVRKVTGGVDDHVRSSRADCATWARTRSRRDASRSARCQETADSTARVPPDTSEGECAGCVRYRHVSSLLERAGIHFRVSHGLGSPGSSPLPSGEPSLKRPDGARSKGVLSRFVKTASSSWSISNRSPKSQWSLLTIPRLKRVLATRQPAKHPGYLAEASQATANPFPRRAIKTIN